MNLAYFNIPCSCDYHSFSISGRVNAGFLLFLKIVSEAWWHMPVIPALGRQRQEDHEFEDHEF
jgi:hypothetical protein